MSDSNFVLKYYLLCAALGNCSLASLSMGLLLGPLSFFVLFHTCLVWSYLTPSKLFLSPPLAIIIFFCCLSAGGHPKLEGEDDIGRMMVNRRKTWGHGHSLCHKQCTPLLTTDTRTMFVIEGEKIVLIFGSKFILPSCLSPPFLVFHWLLCEPVTSAKNP